MPGPTPPTAVRTAFPAPGNRDLDPSGAERLQDLLTKITAYPDSPSGSRGVTAAVVTDHWTWSGAAGTDIRGTPLRPDTTMPVADITKTFVAAEVMQLANAGRLNLELPLSRYVAHPLTRNNATVRQHLSMTAGVPDFDGSDIRALERTIAAAPSRRWSLAEALDYYTGRIQPPDDSFYYSNVSYILLGLMIENITGQPLAAALRHDLADPAGLRHAAFQDAEKPQPPVVQDDNESCGAPDGYLPCRGVASAAAAFAGLAADAPTVARWGYQLYGGRVVPGDLVRQMTAGDGEYGLGTMRFTRQFGSADAYGHGGDLPDHTSLLVVIPQQRVSIAVILADGGRNIYRSMSELARAVQPLLG
ncbi:serine hydrolase domain-containing protein [Kribbella sp. NPDC048915]|uniref:serine hydrolase domain-containing protein n=1 Tax=Kribbella sp. NPDC048915 TaxID=3155148 RepID=UPI003406FAC3